MARVKRAVNAQKKRRTVLERASGYRGQRSRLYRKAKEQMLHSMQYAYRDRRARKGDFRQLWITRINAAARANGMTYNRFIQGLQGRRRRGRPQDPRRHRRQRRGRVRRARRGGQGARCPRRRQSAGDRLSSAQPDHADRAAPHRTRPAGRRCPQAAAPRGPRPGGAVPGRGPAGRPRGAAAGARCTSCSSPTARRRHADSRRCSAAASAVVRSPTRAAAALADTVTPQGVVAVCDLLDVPLAAALRRRAAAGRRAAPAIGRPGQRRHGPADRRRGRRRRRGVRGRHGRPVQRQGVRASAGSLFHLAVAARARPAAVIDALRAAGLTLLAADALRRARPGRPATARRCSPGPVAWLFGGEAHGLPADRGGAADDRVRVPIHGRAESLNLGGGRRGLPVRRSVRAAPRRRDGSR